MYFFNAGETLECSMDQEQKTPESLDADGGQGKDEASQT